MPAPTVDTPVDASSVPAVGELSRDGTRRGALEFSLASLMTATGAGLIGLGAVAFVRAQEHRDSCAAREVSPGFVDPCSFDPPALGFASAGLSWGFAALLGAGAGVLFARGVRVRRDARRFEASMVELAPWWLPGRGGVTLSLRF